MKKKLRDELEGWIYIGIALMFCGVLWFITSGIIILFEK